MNAKQIAEALGGTKTRNGWECRCPAHEDKRPSLSVSDGNKGFPVVYCHSGCTQSAVIDALRECGLWPTSTSSRNGKARRTFPTLDAAVAAFVKDGEVAGQWEYHYGDGRHALTVVRYQTLSGKSYRPFHQAGDGWVCGDPPGRLPLFRLAEVSASTGRLWIVEGEQCVEAAQSIGLTSTASAHGSKAAGKSDWTVLAGRDVVVLPDNDGPGRKYGETVASILTRLDPPAKVRIVDLTAFYSLPDGGDITD